MNDLTYIHEFNYFFQIEESQIHTFSVSLWSCLKDILTLEPSLSPLQQVSPNLTLSDIPNSHRLLS